MENSIIEFKRISMIHSVLLRGANHLSDGLTTPKPDSKQGQDANMALDFYTASFLQEPAPLDAGLLLAPPLSFVPRSVPDENSRSG